MSKVKEVIETYCIDLVLAIRSSLKGAYEISNTNYLPEGMRFIVKENTPAGEMHYEVTVIPQPLMSSSRSEKDLK
jgi:hypothetical protein